MNSKVYFLVVILSIVCVKYGHAQTAEIRKRLEDFKINNNEISSNLKEADAKHYYKMKTVNDSGPDSIITISEYDPSRRSGKRTKLLSINGQPPSKQEAAEFSSRFGRKEAKKSGKIDPDSYKLLADDEEWLIIEFKFIKETLPVKYMFLGDCIGQLHCRKDIMQASFATYTSFKPTQVRMYDADNVDIKIYYDYDGATKNYIHKKAEYFFKITLLDKSREVEIEADYYDYKVVGVH